MANQPIFVASYRQDAATLLAERANQAQDLFTPGTSGTRIHAFALANDGDMSALVEFGTYVMIGDDVTVDIAPGTTADEDPFTVTRSSGAWPELDDGLLLTLSKGSAAKPGRLQAHEPYRYRAHLGEYPRQYDHSGHRNQCVDLWMAAHLVHDGAGPRGL